MARPKTGVVGEVETGKSRLDIDDDSDARLVPSRPAKKPRLMADKMSNDKIKRGPPTSEHDTVGAAFPAQPTDKEKKRPSIGGIGSGIHLRVGRHRESFVRTKLPAIVEEDVVMRDDDETEDEVLDDEILLPVPSARLSVVLDAEDTQNEIMSPVVAGQAAVASGKEMAQEGIAGIEAATQVGCFPDPGRQYGDFNDAGGDGQLVERPWQNIRADLQPVPLPFGHATTRGPQPQPGLAERQEHEAYLEQLHRREVQRHNIVVRPILPPVVFMKQADAYTRLRYSVDILTIQGEKYVRVDETHFLYAFNVEDLVTGENVTIRRGKYADWQADRAAGRPQILFELYPRGEYAYTPENKRRKKAPQDFRPQVDNYGRVMLNSSDRPLKYSSVMPGKVCTEIEGWEMEAICRLDPDICHQDFMDRMLPNEALVGKRRPTKGTLNHRRRRDRMKMRILPWPVPRQLSYSDQQVVKELDARQLENNTTVGLADLSKEEIDMQEAIMYGGHFERSGPNNALNDQARLEQMKANLSLVRTQFTERSDEVKMLKGRVEKLLRKMGRTYDPADWDASVGA